MANKTIPVSHIPITARKCSDCGNKLLVEQGDALTEGEDIWCSTCAPNHA